jgi:CHASE2 domain-containing sensor protein
LWANDKNLSDHDYQFLAASRELERQNIQIALESEQKARAEILQVLNFVAEDRSKTKALSTSYAKVSNLFTWTGPKIATAITLTITSLLLGWRQLGGFEPMELQVFDRMVQLRPEVPPDSRLLVVAITEEDLQKLNRSTPSDQDLAKVLGILEQYQPQTIGLSLYRDFPQLPGQAELTKQLQASNVIANMSLGNPPILPPPGVPPERVGFDDIPIDSDRVVRRQLIFATADTTVYHSFSLRLVLNYLAAQGIFPINAPSNSSYIQINGVLFRALEPNDGGYNGGDTGGYQILLDFRSAQHVARQVSFTDVLKGNLEPDWVRGKIVLIGTTAPSSKILFYTPYSSASEEDIPMPGVILLAQMVSQLLTTVLDGKPLFWFLPDWAENLWIAGWSSVGSVLAWYIRRSFIFCCCLGLAIISLIGISIIIFFQYGWIPVVAPIVTLFLSTLSVRAYRMIRDYQVNQLVQWINQKNQLSERP